MKSNINKFFLILNNYQKRNFYLLVFLMIIATFVEVVGIGLIVPVITLAFESDVLNQSFYKNIFGKFFLIEDKNKLISILLILMLILFFLKTIFFSFLIYFQSSFINDVMEKSTSKLFKKYILQPYDFFLDTNSSQIINNINQEINQTVVSFINNFFLLIIDFILFTGIFLLLAFYQPIVLPILLVFSLLIFAFLKYILRNFLEKAGKLRHESEEARLKYLQQSFFGIKEIKISGKEKSFFEKYKNHLVIIVKLRKIMQVINYLPKYWLEFIFISLFLIYILSYNLYFNDIKNTIASLGLFSIAAYKILPLLNRVTVSYQSIQFASKPLEKILLELDNIGKISNFSSNISDKFDFNNNVEIKNLSFKYKSTENLILNNINLQIKHLDFVGIFGESGNGKTTLVDIMIGLLKPTEGDILVDGKNINSDFSKWRNSVGYVPQDIFILDDTLKKNVAFGFNDEEINDEQVINALKMANLENFLFNLKDGINFNLGENASNISGGQKQRIGIARALYNKPNLLVLDEATSSLDKNTEQEVLNTLSKLNTEITIIMITHNINRLKICNRVIELKNNNISVLK